MAASPFSLLLSGKQDDKPNYIRQSLSLAVETRADFHMDFFANKRNLFQMKGACVEVRPDTLRIYLRGETTEAPVVGLQVHVYFSLRVEHKTLPCDFASEVIGTERSGQDTFVLLAIPKDMGHNQRRYNVRIPITKADIGNFRVWYGKPVGDEGGGKAVRVDWLPLQKEHMELLDISAGGMHVGVSAQSPLLSCLTKRELLLASGEFPVKGKITPPLTMVGSIVRVISDDTLPLTRIGVNFRRWAPVKKGALNWMPLGSQEGIAPLGAWVFQTILERSKIQRDSN